MKKKGTGKNPELTFDVVTVGERGQIVIPSKIRKSLSLKAGEQLIVIENPIAKAVVLLSPERISSAIEQVIHANDITLNIRNK
ncbi:MAG: AbrB/MazE/SpoVT family DNA-binding domain-containing protein [Candidatus Margulisiibacteriota bacterium]